MYVHKFLSATEIFRDKNTPFPDSIWLQLKVNKKEDVTIGCVYRSPNSHTQNNSNLVAWMNKIATPETISSDVYRTPSYTST